VATARPRVRPSSDHEEEDAFIDSLSLVAVARAWNLSVATFNAEGGNRLGSYRCSTVGEVINRRYLAVGRKGPLFWEAHPQGLYPTAMRNANPELRVLSGMADIRPHDFRKSENRARGRGLRALDDRTALWQRWRREEAVVVRLL
jgi:hypothetical protein